MSAETVELEKKGIDHVDAMHYDIAVLLSKRFGLLAYGTTTFVMGCLMGSLITYLVLRYLVGT